MGAVGEVLRLTADDRRQLVAMSRSAALPAGLARRVAVVLLAADGVASAEVARRTGVSRQTVATWRKRYAEAGIAGLADAARPGRPHVVSSYDLLAATLRLPQPPRGSWTTRSLASVLGVGHATVARAWHEQGVRPVRGGRYRFATVPDLEVGSVRLVGLHLDARHRMALLAVDGPDAERVLRAVTGASSDRTTFALTTVQPPGAVDVRTALRSGPTSSDLLADTGAPAVAFLDGVVRTRGTLLADARLHLVVHDAATLRDPAVHAALARQQPRLTTHLATRPWTWPGLVAAAVLMGDRRPGAAVGEHPAEGVDGLLAALIGSPAADGAAWSFTWASATRESVRRAPVPPVRPGPPVASRPVGARARRPAPAGARLS